MRKLFVVAMLLAGVGIAAQHVHAQGNYPNRPIRLVVGFPPGGAYDYVSGCPLATASGRMQGRYVMMGEDGVRYTVVIPAFALDVPVGRPPVH